MRSIKMTLEPGIFEKISAESLRMVLFTNKLRLFFIFVSLILFTIKPFLSVAEFIVVMRKVFIPRTP